MKIQGIEGMSPDRLQFEIQRGAKFVFYQYAISVLVMTFAALPTFSSPRERTRSQKDCHGI